MAPADAMLDIEVAFSASARHVELKSLRLPNGSTVADALAASGLVMDASLSTGVWGRRAPLTQALHDGDRVEICRALQVDPKQARRLRQQRQRGPKPPR